MTPQDEEFKLMMSFNPLTRMHSDPMLGENAHIALRGFHTTLIKDQSFYEHVAIGTSAAVATWNPRLHKLDINQEAFGHIVRSIISTASQQLGASLRTLGRMPTDEECNIQALEQALKLKHKRLQRKAQNLAHR